MSYVFAILSAAIVITMLAMWIVRYAPDLSRRRQGIVGLLIVFAGTAALGSSQLLSDFSRFPPPLMGLLGGIIVFALLAVLSPWGRDMAAATPLRLLIGLQTFRVLPELLLHFAWMDGLAPIQMTFHGMNADILTAITAALLFSLWPHLKQPRLWAIAHTVLGLTLLTVIVTIAVLSAPTPMRTFMNEPANTFVTHFPYVWLPGVHVLTALLLHGLSSRKLLSRRLS